MPEPKSFPRRLPLPPWPPKPTERGPGGRLLCRCGCGVEVAPPRRTWATPECLERVRLRCDWKVVRKHVYEIGRGLCAVCGCHPESRRAQAREALLEGDRALLEAARVEGWPRLGRAWYEIDHVTPVSAGGAQHGRKNLRVLCYRCHVAHTAAQNRARAEARAAAKRAIVEAQAGATAQTEVTEQRKPKPRAPKRKTAKRSSA